MRTSFIHHVSPVAGACADTRAQGVQYRMSKDKRIFDLEERLIDFTIFVTSVKTAKQKEDKKTS